ncbi:sigma-70 family RNA polymerase sigma factor [Leptothoe spongobia]|uniref:Sigma-70 family RNA polymerase sigma factor n=1 Tax=Leptothoe spongobia TAU-MAC 1115 TaxID=1967444 RepID=A0A947DFS5_9CYAN|nr:sigma-70 family RNA polymerase sigma factor [Leptothoe spongobia]MBT9316238.1 sigma-70 family RNA polymerase sigma factor [Leptothoe spongobia TAU-MAC 1115]
MNDLQEQVQILIAEACRHPIGSLQRQKHLTKIIHLISNRLWHENTSYYQDALQQTWMYFCQNLCEGKTGNVYDPKKASVITWLNAYLKRRLQDGYIDVQKQRARTLNHLSSGTDSVTQSTDPVDRLAAQPDIPPLLAEIRAWAKSDPGRKLTRIHLTNHPHITCQLLILKRLPPETPWKELATEFGVTISTLSSFYQRKCMPLLCEFAKSQGYL